MNNSLELFCLQDFATVRTTGHLFWDLGLGPGLNHEHIVGGNGDAGLFWFLFRVSNSTLHFENKDFST